MVGKTGYKWKIAISEGLPQRNGDNKLFVFFKLTCITVSHFLLVAVSSSMIMRKITTLMFLTALLFLLKCDLLIFVWTLKSDKTHGPSMSKPNTIIVAVTKLLQGHGRTSPPLPRGSVSPVQRCLLCYTASSKLFSFTWTPLFVSQHCMILLWPWTMQFGDGYYDRKLSGTVSFKWRTHPT
jgi:hypothetical protein